MRMLDLFSGIGGFHLAAEWVWGDELEVIAHVEIDPFCQKVLKKHWPEVPITDDVREYKHDGTDVGIITGGPPCQATSVAAAIQGSRSNKTLYPAMGNIVGLVRPQWVIIEQPPGNKKWEAAVAKHLEDIGYAVAKFERSASDFGAPHRRRRSFFVANTNRKRLFEIARIRGTSPTEKKPWLAPPRGAWRSARTGYCRMDDGLSSWVDRLKSLGNAIVPQCVVPIMEAIKNEQTSIY